MFKEKNVMIIGIQFLKDGKLRVTYLLKTPLHIDEYKGLVVLDFKTDNRSLFDGFNSFGKWLKGSFDFNGRIVGLH